MTFEPAVDGLRLVHEHGRSLRISAGEVQLLRYVYQPWDVQLESPRPYFHPIHTLGGNLVSLYRPHDHVWHKGIAWSLPNVGPANFWGGVTYLRDQGYVQLPNNGTMRHRSFDLLAAGPQQVRVAHRLDWITESGDTWFSEVRSFAVSLDPGQDSWTLAFATQFTNVSGQQITIGSPTTQGRDNAGYGGLFWRGPRSFSGGTIHVPGRSGGDELMGTRAPWLAFTGRHDEAGGASTLAFVDAPTNPEHPTQWFARTDIFACVCPAPFFSTELVVEPRTTVDRRYAVVIADGDRGEAGAAQLAKTGQEALAALGDGDDGPQP